MLLAPRTVVLGSLSLCACLAAIACGGAPSEAPAAKSPTALAPPKPRCPPDVDSEPSNAAAKMSELEAPLRKCFALGTAGPSGVSTLQLELTIAESGSVKHAKVRAEGAQPAAAECAEKAAKQARFRNFCGADASIRWTYTLQ